LREDHLSGGSRLKGSFTEVFLHFWLNLLFGYLDCSAILHVINQVGKKDETLLFVALGHSHDLSVLCSLIAAPRSFFSLSSFRGKSK
jgi:hypothetical protein